MSGGSDDPTKVKAPVASSTTPVTPSGFEAATPYEVGGDPAPNVRPAVMPAAPGQMSQMGFPSWISQFFGGSSSPQGNSYVKGYNPGAFAGPSGFGMGRDVTAYMPNRTPKIPASAPTGSGELFTEAELAELEKTGGYNGGLSTTAPTAAQQKLERYRKLFGLNQNGYDGGAGNGGNSGGGYGGSQSGGGGAGGLY
jgi:hypothetical protein